MKLYHLISGCTITALFCMASCKKDNNDFFYKAEAIPVTVMGYNGSAENLQIKLDTTVVQQTIPSSASFENSTAYTFWGDQKSVKLSVCEQTSGKLLLEKELKKEDGPAKLSFFYMDGKVGDWPEKPAVENDKLKIIYMFMPKITNYKEPVDIVFGKYYLTPQVFEEITRISSLKPYEFSAPAVLPTFSTARQDYNGVSTTVSFLVRVFKAGTNIPYVEGSSYIWNALSSTAPKPSSSVASSKLYIFEEAPAGTTMRFFTKLDF